MTGMAFLTDADLAYLRSELGSEPTDDDLSDRYFRLGNAPAVALEVLRGRLNDLVLGGPASFSIAGEYSEGNEANIRALQAATDRLQARVDADAEQAATASAGSGRVVRCDRVR